MIETSRVATERAEPSAENAPRYRIDPSWFEENNLSFEDIVRARICDQCRQMLGTEREERVPVFDQKTGRPHFEVRRYVYGSDPVRVIHDHCGKSKHYISRDMPTLEAIFRVFLANNNQPMPLEHVREQLTEWCPGGGCQWLLLPIETLDRLVKTDTYYGLQQVLLPTDQA